MTDYSNMTPEQLEAEYEAARKKAAKEAAEADEGWSDNVEFIED